MHTRWCLAVQCQNGVFQLYAHRSWSGSSTNLEDGSPVFNPKLKSKGPTAATYLPSSNAPYLRMPVCPSSWLAPRPVSLARLRIALHSSTEKRVDSCILRCVSQSKETDVAPFGAFPNRTKVDFCAFRGVSWSGD